MKDDEWETPKKLFEWLCTKYAFYPHIDVCANKNNKKCVMYFGKDTLYPTERDGLTCSWYDKNWMNCPHTETEKWVKKACFEFINYGRETMAIIPANSMCTAYAESCIEPHAEYHPIFERPKFLKDKEEKDVSRNSYFVVIWRRK